MDRLVPLSDPRRKRAGAIRLGEVPGLFSEGPEEDPSQRLVLPSLDEIKARLGQLFQPSAD
jgi:hypothetical protein